MNFRLVQLTEELDVKRIEVKATRATYEHVATQAAIAKADYEISQIAARPEENGQAQEELCYA